MLDTHLLVSLLFLCNLAFVACGDDAPGPADTSAQVDASETTSDASSDDTEVALSDTNLPDETAVPDDTTMPVDTIAPDDTTTPVDTITTDDTTVPDDTTTPADTSVPDDTRVPDDTDGPEIDTVEVEVVAPQPRLALVGPDGPLADGDVIDAGDQEVGVPFVRTYTITNDGDEVLKVSAVTFPKAAPLNCEQELSTPPAASVPPGGSTDFEIAATVLAAGAANCPFTIASDDPDTSLLTVDVNATGVEPTPAVKKAATATCGASSGFGFLVAVLADMTYDGTLVTTNTRIDNCWLTVEVGTQPGGTLVNEAADTASCNTLSCTEGNEECRAFGGVPYSAGAAVTVSMSDPLLGGTVSHVFPKAPGTLTRSSVGAGVSRGAPLTITTAGGVAGTLTLVTINQENVDGQTTLVCDFPAESASVTIPTNLLDLFHDGPFNLLVDTRVQAFEVANGYDVALVVVNSTLPQQSTFVP